MLTRSVHTHTELDLVDVVEQGPDSKSNCLLYAPYNMPKNLSSSRMTAESLKEEIQTMPITHQFTMIANV